ncbi:MAG: site-2 protease family protein [Pseudanabaenaceae cyanobacterium]
MTVELGFSTLLGMVGVVALVYMWLGYRHRQVTESVPMPVRRSMSGEDLRKLQGAFSIDTFYATSINNYQDGAIVRGNLRSDPANAYFQVKTGIQRLLGDGYQLFLVEGQDRRPMMVVLPERPVSTVSWREKALAGLLLFLTIIACIWVGQEWQLGWGVVIVIGLIVGVRILARWWVAKQYQIGMGVPCLLPSWQLGCFGLADRFISPVPDRRVLFELAIAPTVASGLLSLVLVGVGLWLSAMGQAEMEIPSQIFQASVLMALLAKLALGSSLHSNFVVIHPLVLLGWLGLGITALNLLPAGQLDGGRLVQAIYGRMTASWTTVLTLVCLAIVALFQPIALYWGVVILFLLRDLEPPMLNELVETTPEQDGIGILLLFLMLLVLFPLTPTVAEFLQIGG